MFNLIQKYYQWKHKGGLDLKLQEQHAKDNYVLGWSLFGGEYTPKSQKVELSTMEQFNQQNLNMCVLCSGTAQKEPDEGCLLDMEYAAAYLKGKGQLTPTGTSLSAWQDMLRNVGIPDRQGEVNFNQSYDSFSSKSKLTTNKANNAAIHKIESSYRTDDINQVLKELDNGKRGHAGGTWYSGYNPSQLSDTCILTARSGYVVGGHATCIIGYNLNYNGNKVLIVKQSYGDWRPKFYVKFQDFNTVFNAGVYFNTDLPKNVLGWLSINQGRCVLSQDGVKVYYIDSDVKRYVVDEAVMTLLGYTPANLEYDSDNMLEEVNQGSDMTFQDVPIAVREKTKYMLQQIKNPNQDLKTLWGKYYPDI